MKRGILFLKVAVSLLSAAVIIALLLFGDSIPKWLGKEKTPVSVSRTEAEEAAAETAEDQEEQRETTAKETTAPQDEDEDTTPDEAEETNSEAESMAETDLQEESAEESSSEGETVPETKEAAALPEGAEQPYLAIVPESLVVTRQEEENLIGILLESGELQANDGTGNIRAEQIAYELEQMYQDAEGNLTLDSAQTLKKGFYTVVFTLTDDWNRQTECTSILVIADEVEGPIITLKERSVTLKTGDTFQYLNYIQQAVDPTDGDISGRVQLEGQVDTAVPGQYLIKYFARNLSGVRSPKATLIVTVE